MKILDFSEISLDRWNSLLSKTPYASIFQTNGFYELFNSVNGLSAKVFAVEDNIEIKALCVVTFQKESGFKGFFSRRAIIYGGPVFSNANVQYLEVLLESISKEYKRKAIYTEIRSLYDYSLYNTVFEKNNWKYLPYQNYLVDCSDKDKLLQKLGNNRKRQIKKAISTGIVIKEAENIYEIQDFYSILKNLYKQKIRKPLFPRQFFEEFLNRNLGKCLLVMYKDKIIGGIICPILENKCIYELYVCGLDDEYKEQYPSVMATWAAMEYANQNNIPFFDFMGAGRKDKDYGVREFKSRFGGELVENGRYIKINNIFLFKIGEFALNLLKKMKI